MQFLARLVDRLTAPDPRISAPEVRRGTRLFSVLTLLHVVVVLSAVPLIQTLMLRRMGRNLLAEPAGWVMLSGVALITCCYGLLRAGWFKPGVVLYIVATAGVAVVTPFVGQGPAVPLLATGVIPVLLTAMVFPTRWALAVLVSIVAAVAIGATLFPPPGDQYVALYLLLVVVAVVSVLIVVFRSHVLATMLESQQQLRSSEEQYRRLFETVTDGIFVADRSGRILEVNAGACRQLGFSREELCSRTLGDIVAQSDTPPEKMRDLLAAGGFAVADSVHRHKDGSEVPVELVVSRMDYQGAAAFLGVARDVSARNRALREKERLEAQLHQTSKLEAIGQLAGGVAHDFNNLLTVIKSSAELAGVDLRQQRPVDGYIADIAGAAESASALTRQLLAFSRKQVIDAAHVDLNQVLSRMRGLLGRLIGEDIALQTKAGAGLGTVFADPGLVEQCVLNLAVNARDAMPNGGQLLLETTNVTLDADFQASHPLVAPGDYVLLSVTDTGVGMSEEVKRRLFEPFFTTKELGRGTGLGLATVYGTVMQSGGSVEVYSELGKGTAFKLYFPRVEGPTDAPAPARTKLDAPPRGAETILVVEDDPMVRDLTVRMLDRLGYAVYAQSNAEHALAFARERSQPIHLLITDVVMPGMNGRQLATALGKSHPETRVLYTSGYSQNVIAHHGVLDAGIAYLSKPFSLQSLATKIREVLDGAPAG
jgi:two-component system, cell cycle sensor histidine kinase and response regulator CckA